VLRQAEARAKKSGGKVTLVPVKKGKAGRKWDSFPSDFPFCTNMQFFV
jgi:hypothetical protein